MRKLRNLYVALAFLLAASLLLAACGGQATPTAAPAATQAPVVTEAATQAPAATQAATEAMTQAATQAATEAATQAMTEAATATEAMAGTQPAAAGDIGTADHPIKVLFVPSVEANVITTGGDVMAKALEQATGLKFQVSVPTSYAATIEEMCASPSDTMGFIPALGYVLANQLCGVDVAFKAIRNGSDVYYTEFLVPRDSSAQSLKDLSGKKWGFPDVGSTSGYMVPLVMFQEQGITPGEKVETGGHTQAVTALYNGSVDFATVYYSPPLNPQGQTVWKPGDPPDISDNLISTCAPSADGKKLMCNGWQVLDARANIRTQAPDVVQKLRILTISPAIPNDTLSFGPQFPPDLRAKIEKALVDFSKTPEWQNSIGSTDFYGWTGLSPATDAEYDFVRKMVTAAGITMQNIGK